MNLGENFVSSSTIKLVTLAVYCLANFLQVLQMEHSLLTVWVTPSTSDKKDLSLCLMLKTLA